MKRSYKKNEKLISKLWREFKSPLVEFCNYVPNRDYKFLRGLAITVWLSLKKVFLLIAKEVVKKSYSIEEEVDSSDPNEKVKRHAFLKFKYGLKGCNLQFEDLGNIEETPDRNKCAYHINRVILENKKLFYRCEGTKQLKVTFGTELNRCFKGVFPNINLVYMSGYNYLMFTKSEFQDFKREVRKVFINENLKFYKTEDLVNKNEI